MREKRYCVIDGCGRLYYARGWCSMHYTRWLRHGDPLIVLHGGGLPPHVTAHGTANEYRNYGCRCDLCRAAHVEYQRATLTGGYSETPCACGRMKKYNARTCMACYLENRPKAQHGTESGYRGGCRCEPCRRAATLARRRRRARVAT